MHGDLVPGVGVLSGQPDPSLADNDDGPALFESARAVYAENPAEAERLYRRAADVGEPRAMYNLGGLHAERGDLEGARTWWARAADLGLDSAMYNLGVSYLETDPEQTLVWWERAARCGNVEAAYWLGLSLKSSDSAQARKYLAQAAEGGKVDADFNLGVMLAQTDPEMAETHYRHAVAAGDARSMYNLAILLVRRDTVSYEAIELMRNAAALGLEPAKAGISDWPRIIDEAKRSRRRIRGFRR